MLKNICIIPARGGSKRLPKKNLRLLDGIPLVAHTFRATKDSGVFDKIVVSSDDEEILALAEDYYLVPDQRPPSLATDSALAKDVVLEWLGRTNSCKEEDNIAMCLPTCPLRTAEHLREAMCLFHSMKNQITSLIGISRYDFPPQLALKLLPNGKYVTPLKQRAYKKTRSQDIEPYYRPNGSIYVSSIQNFYTSGSFFGSLMGAYILPAEYSIDIDYEYEFLLAESLLRAYK